MTLLPTRLRLDIPQAIRLFPFIERRTGDVPKSLSPIASGLLAVSLAMILLPLIYFAIIGLCCYGLYRYTADYLSDIFDTPLGYSRGAVLLYFLAVDLAFFVGTCSSSFSSRQTPLLRPKPETPPIALPRITPMRQNSSPSLAASAARWTRRFPAALTSISASMLRRRLSRRDAQPLRQ